MLSKQEVKVAFLEKCASLGMNAEQIERAASHVLSQLQKSAADPSSFNPAKWVTDFLGSAADAGKKTIDLGRTAVNTGLQYGVAAPYTAAAGTGLVGGFALGKALAPQQTADEVKNQETADTYRQYADYLTRQAQLAKAQQQQKLKSPSFR